MDEAEGFFPERRLLAYRRSLLQAQPVPAAPARQKGSAWWILFICMGPSYFATMASMFRRHSTGAVPPVILYLMLASCVLMACAVIAVALVLATRGGLRTQKPFTPE